MRNFFAAAAVASALLLTSCGTATPTENTTVINANGLPQNLSNMNVSIDTNTNVNAMTGTGNVLPY